MKTETVYFGDCLEHLKLWIRWNKGIFEGQPSQPDLIYLDPPWNSNANYNVLFGSGKADADDSQTAQETAFTDMWQWGPEADIRVKKICGIIADPDYDDHPAKKSMRGLRAFINETGMLAYCSYMAERLALLHAMLKETGSIFLHCDPYASHYLKMVMDDIFSAKNFRNEIVWKRTVRGFKGSQFLPRKFNTNTDIILYYAKSKKHAYFRMDRVLEPYSIEYQEKAFKLEDKKGRYYLDVAANRKGASARPNLCYKYKPSGQTKEFFPPHPSGWKVGRERMEELEKSGELVVQKGRLYRKIRPKEGKIRNNLWDDVPEPKGKEAEGKYPTQKPLKLLERIIKASTDEGDVVLDPFCGCGTAVVASSMLKRKFVGIDISLFSVETVTSDRLNKEAGIGEEDIKILGRPADLESAKRFAKDDPFAFERFAVEACSPGMVANKIQQADKGIDGRGKLLHPVKEKGKKKSMILAQVKAGKPSLSHVRDFAHVIQSTEGAVAGVFITVNKGDWKDSMREVAYQLGTFRHEHSAEEFPRLQHWHIGQWWWKTPHLRLPRLPELADPLSGKEMTALKQTGFLMKRYGSG